MTYNRDSMTLLNKFGIFPLCLFFIFIIHSTSALKDLVLIIRDKLVKNGPNKFVKDSLQKIEKT